MKLLLKDFQTEAVTDFVGKLRRAAREVGGYGELQSVALSSPTGSGKTVMAAAAIERLIQGDDTHGPNPEATFLWITDQPELNEQTRRKMVEASTVLSSSNVVVIDQSFDEEAFWSGNLYFLNTQKLGKNSNLVKAGDARTFTLWETLTNTINERPENFYVFIDEAHRGMVESKNNREEATAIIQRFIKGSDGEIPKVPLVAGISATPDRFNRLIEGTGRTARSVDIDTEDVRNSGLLKEIVTLYHPTEDQPSNMTMLRAAARSWRGFSRRWDGYCRAQGEPPLRPVLVVQVENASGKKVSKTDIAGAMTAIEEEAGSLSDAAFAHALQESGDLAFNDRTVRYLAPADVDADPDVRVVFFKTALNTGWDCPRAEVMMSFRSANDATLIAQLVGRMVRTPLARRVESDEHLNTVALYLPHYDEAGLRSVVDKLSTPDPSILPPVDVKTGENAATLERASNSDAAFAALEEITSYTMPNAQKTGEVKRLMKLSRRLAQDGLDPNAVEKAEDLMLGVLRSEYVRLHANQKFRDFVEGKGKLEVRAVDWRMWADTPLDGSVETVELDTSAENVDDLFDAAGRKLVEGLHKAWRKSRYEEDQSTIKRAKLEAFALSADPEVLRKLQAEAQGVAQQRLKDHKTAIKNLPEGERQAYDEVRKLASDPEPTTVSYPKTIEGSKAAARWNKHLYVEGGSAYPAKLNGWETKVVEHELAKDEVVGWLRNPPKKSWSLRIPYVMGGRQRPLYPDFLFLREEDGELEVDLLDPHRVDLEDAPAKAAGLGMYADKHAHEFGRIELIIVDGDDIKRLDLTDETLRDKVKGVSSNHHLRTLYEEAPFS